MTGLVPAFFSDVGEESPLTGRLQGLQGLERTTGQHRSPGEWGLAELGFAEMPHSHFAEMPHSGENENAKSTC